MVKKPSSDDFFSYHPPMEQMPIKYRIRRCPPGGLNGGIILSGRVFGKELHYTGRQSRVCPGEDCPVCTDHNRPRWRGYVFVWNQKTDEKVIFELTPGAMRNVHDYYCEHRSLRGATINAWRDNGEANGKLFVTLKQSRIDKELLPKTPSLSKILCRMWGISFDQSNAEDPELRLRILEDLDKRPKKPA